MKHSKLFIFAIMTTLAVSGCKHQAATYPTDTLTTKNGSQLTITFFKHASLAIETEGRHIYIDPISQYADYASLPKADLILITHSHYDIWTARPSPLSPPQPQPSCATGPAAKRWEASA